MLDNALVVRVIVSCALVCGFAWGLGVWLKRLPSLMGTKRRHLQVLEAMPLGGGKSLLLVACQGRKFLLAVTMQNIQLLAELAPSPQPTNLMALPDESDLTEGDWQSGTGDAELDDKGCRSRENFLAPRNLSCKLFRFLPLLFLLALCPFAHAQSQGLVAPSQLSLMRESVQILLVLTLIALAPFLLATITCFTRIIIVLSLLRVAMGTPQTPPNPVVIGIALFLTLFVMAPTLQEANEKGLQPFLRNEKSLEQALADGYKPFQRFMLRQVREKDIALFLRIAKLSNPRTQEEVPAHILVPAFILSEVRTGFEIGFLLAIPFLLVDLVVASVLMGMGMLMVPPMLLSLPLKLLLFILADGWHLLMRGLALSVR